MTTPTPLDQSALPPMLLLDDDAMITRFVSSKLSSHFRIVMLDSVAVAIEQLLSGGALCGAVIDMTLPDGSGVEFLEQLRRSGSRVPALVLTNSFQPEVASAVQLFGAEFLPKPYDLAGLSQHLEAFAARVRAFADSENSHNARLDALTTQYSLSKREAQVLGLALESKTRADMLKVLGTSLNTLKTQIRSLLRKTDSASLDELVRAIRAGTRAQ